MHLQELANTYNLTCILNIFLHITWLHLTNNDNSIQNHFKVKKTCTNCGDNNRKA